VEVPAMPIRDTLATALTAIAAHRLRAALTILGVTIGVAAVIAMVSLGQGASDVVRSTLQGLGTNMVFVTPGSRTTGMAQAVTSGVSTLTLDDVDALEAPGAVPGALDVEPEQSGFVTTKWRDATTVTQLVGTTPAYVEVRDVRAETGRFIDSGDVTAAAPVAVLGRTTARDLFGDPAAALDQRIEVKIASPSGTRTVRLRVIGILESRGQVAGMVDLDKLVVVPITTSQRRIYGRDTVGAIIVSARTPDQMAQVQHDVAEVLRVQHRLGRGEELDFTVQTQQELLSAAALVSDIFTVLLGAIGGLSLLVGGIGIMNIMLVSVTERTREIGLRKAVGARRHDILTQFLVEAVALTGVGGIVGILIGATMAMLISAFSPIDAAISPSTVLIALAISSLVGIVFGLYPAMRAASLQPIAALRAD